MHFKQFLPCKKVTTKTLKMSFQSRLDDGIISKRNYQPSETIWKE